MNHRLFFNPLSSCWFHLSYIMLMFCFSTYAAEPLDGFRDLKFSMTPKEVKALKSCSTSHECLYELSNKVRYLHLTYDKDTTNTDSDSTEPPRLTKITIDMGQYSDAWHQQLQMVLSTSYRLTHDFSDETMNAFLDKKFEELNAGYEDGQIVLKVVRRQFGNMVLKVVYQNTALAAEFIRKIDSPHTTKP